MSLIVIYDSGVGGLSIYQAVAERCPQNDYVFVSDNEAFPYGIKPEAELVTRVTQLVERIAEHYAPDILVLACNTASTVMLPILREKFNFEIVGVVPAIKPAAKLSKSRHIGLLATPATIERDYTEKLIEEFASDCRVTRVGSNELVEMAERKLRGDVVDMARLTSILAPFFDVDGLDVLILACTHFPLLNNEITEVLQLNSAGVILLDSGDGVANRVAQLSDANDGLNAHSTAAFTRTLDEPELFDRLAQLGFSEIEVLEV